MKKLGFTDKIKKLLPDNIDESEVGRVIIEHKERYVVQTNEGTFMSEITGNLRYSAASRADFPAVGDWVRLMKMDEQNAIIVEVLPRFSTLKRQAVGKETSIQIIGANIDFAFLVQAVGHDFNLNRLDRYISICHTANIQPLVVLTKTDLADKNELEQLKGELLRRVNGIPIFTTSTKTEDGLDELRESMLPYHTYCFLGSSGVGKSTLVNCFSSSELLKTSHISDSTQKGRHTTSHRELVVLDNGGIVIDTPGMRELGMAEDSTGIEETYDEISRLTEACRYSDCTHTNEDGCAIQEALEDGELDYDVFENYQKLKREQEHYSASIHERRQKDKQFGKMVRSVKEHKKQFKQ